MNNRTELALEIILVLILVVGVAGLLTVYRAHVETSPTYAVIIASLSVLTLFSMGGLVSSVHQRLRR